MLAKTPIEIAADDLGRLTLVKGPPPGSEIVVAGPMAVSDGQNVRRFTDFGK